MSLAERRLRLGTGLVLTIYIVQHLLNHTLGLISYELMEEVREYVVTLWRHPLVGTLFYTCLLTHFALALVSLYRRSTLRLPAWELAQLVLGLSIIPLLSLHVAGTLGARVLLDSEPDYEIVISYVFDDPWKTLRYMLLIAVAWIHVCVGLHFWLRLKRWYRKYLPVLYGLALLIPVLAVLSVTRVSIELDEMSDDFLLEEDAILSMEVEPEGDEQQGLSAQFLEQMVLLVFAVLLAATLLARRARYQMQKRRGVYRISHPSGRQLTGLVGQTMLETIRNHGVPHASVCGGRARCTTCRVRLAGGLDLCDSPATIEAQALTRIGAAPNVRLACQVRPRGDVQITPLVPVREAMTSLNRPGSVHGTEKQIAILFVDLRGSTALGEKKLPYDVLFILNRFFAEMTEVLQQTHGHYAQFAGDGLMALYGLRRGIEQGCRDALAGAKGMQEKVETLNAYFAEELDTPLRIGLGVHCGEAIVGTMGPPMSPNYSAIGDNVNAAARLESLTKELGCLLLVSRNVVDQAGLQLSVGRMQQVAVRGKSEMLEVFALDAETLSGLDLSEQSGQEKRS